MLVKKFLSPAIMLIVAGLFPLSSLFGNAPAVEAVWNSSTAHSADTPGIILKHCTRNSGSALRMDGRKSEIAFKGSENWNVAASATLHGVFRIAPEAGSAPDHAGHDAFFYKHNQLFIGLIGEQIYFNFFNGSAWAGALYGNVKFKPEPDRFYSITLTVSVHRDIAQGELWTDVEIYLDGLCIAQKRFEQSAPGESAAPLEAGCATGFGDVWHLGGEVGALYAFRRVLSENEIRQLVVKDQRVTPAFSLPRTLPDSLSSALHHLASSNKPELRAGASIIRNWFLAGGTAAAAEAMCSQLAKVQQLPDTLGNGALEVLKFPESILSISRTPAASVISWYDMQADRELWNPDSKLWEAKIKSSGKYQTATAVKSSLAKLEKKNSRAEFIFSSPEVWGNCEIRGTFDGKRLEMQLDTASAPGHIIESVTFPAFTLNPLTQGCDNLLVPCMSGRVIENAVKSRASFSSDYPRGYCSMQLGAYYDTAGGIYFSSEDSTGQLKHLKFLADSSGVNVSYTFYPGWEAGSECNAFTTSNCGIELFRGNWYQAGMIYRNNLAKNRPVWWSPEQPRKSIPQWMQNNLIWIRLEGKAVPEAIMLQEYIGEPLALHWYLWSGQTFDRDYPFMHPAPFTVEQLEMAHNAGMKVVPYLNGRIWEIQDFRSEQRATNSLGKPNFVTMENGEPVLERGVVSYNVMCFATPMSREILFRQMDRLITLGCDGVYLDQVAASSPRRCYNPAHRHKIAAGDVWFRHGHLPLLQHARDKWASLGPDKVITSEDNSEIYAGHVDGLLGWRWMYDGQVPLFMLVYSGRTHLVGIDYSNELGNGVYAKLATQLTWGEQLGWFMMSYITSPYQQNFRLYLKRAAHFRKVMLEFFNSGIMLPPPQLQNRIPPVRTRWGLHGTQYLSTPPVVVSRWQLGDIQAFMLANTTESMQQNTLLTGLDTAQRRKLYLFNGNGKFDVLPADIHTSQDFVLDPLQVMLILAVPEDADAEKLISLASSEFTRIAGAERQADPFAPISDYSAPGPTSAATDWHDGVKAVSVEGGRINTAKNHVSHCNECVIDFGTVDFGDTPLTHLEAVFAVPGYLTGGKVTFRLDHPVTGPVLAERCLDTGTGGWGDYKPYTFEIKGSVTGKRKVFIRIGGIFLCNFKSWRAIAK